METDTTGPDFPVSEKISKNLRGLENVSTFIEESIEEERIMGAVALVAKKGKIIHFEVEFTKNFKCLVTYQIEFYTCYLLSL